MKMDVSNLSLYEIEDLTEILERRWNVWLRRVGDRLELVI